MLVDHALSAGRKIALGDLGARDERGAWAVRASVPGGTIV